MSLYNFTILLALRHCLLLTDESDVWRGPSARLAGRVIEDGTGRPVAGAPVVLPGTSYASTTDSTGSFAIADVLPGEYDVEARSPQLEALGIDAQTTLRLVLADSSSAITLRMPLLRTALARACACAIRDTLGAVQGRVEDAQHRAVGAARVMARWYTSARDAGSGLMANSSTLSILTDADGRFRLCGVARQHTVSLSAARDHLVASRESVRLEPDQELAVVTLDALPARPAGWIRQNLPNDEHLLASTSANRASGAARRPHRRTRPRALDESRAGSHYTASRSAACSLAAPFQSRTMCKSKPSRAPSVRGSAVFGLVVAAVLSGGSPASAQSAAPPQLGKATLQQVVAALTPEEKVRLVVGMGFYPAGFPAGMLPPGMPGDDKVAEKVAGAAGRTHAIPRLGIPSLTFSDGPAGVRIDPLRAGDSTRTYYATAFPVATLLASTWDTAMVRRVGAALGGEVRAFGIDVLLAPGMNIHRNPLGGRNFEYYSEDPVVAGNMAAALVNGVQSNGVGTSIKHFAANNQEFNRMQLNSRVSERALREVYLKGFQIAVRKSQPWTVMSSYNRVNGTYTSESHDLLTVLLRHEWGFKGLVMSDWYGGSNPVAQLAAGNDLLMPGTQAQAQRLLDGLKNGQLSTGQLDASVTRVLELVLKSPTFKGDGYNSQPALQADAAVARQAAAEGMVLLRNEGNTLPLAPARKVAAFGNASYQLIAGGTGSGDVNKAYTVSIAQGLAAAGFSIDDALRQSYERHLTAERSKLPRRRGLLAPAPVLAEMSTSDIQLQRLAKEADVALVTIGRSAGEGGDRKEVDDFTLTAAEHALITQVATAFHAEGKKLVVVLNVGGVVEVASWLNQVDALLLAWQPGQEGGHAVADLLSGKVTPSGKLATTFPVAYSDVPYGEDFPGKELPGGTGTTNSLMGKPSENSYSEGIYVGYRYYNTFKVKPAYEFGYGLSYTTFGYGKPKLSAVSTAGRVTASVTVTNNGKVPGKEVVQLYVRAPGGKLDKPESELKAFAKTTLLRPGQSQSLAFPLAAADLASYDASASAWIADAGVYTVKIGASSLNIRQAASFRLPTRIVVQKSRPLLAPQADVADLKAGGKKPGRNQ